MLHSMVMLFVLVLTDKISATITSSIHHNHNNDNTVKLGEPELVFVGGTSVGSCDDFDLPDAPARAWRDDMGTVHLAASWATSRFSHGPELGSVKHSCDVVFNSTMSGVNALYADHEWILAPYLLEDNVTVMGVAHQEYHGFDHDNCSLCVPGHHTPGCVLPADKVKQCWMVALTSTISLDRGYTFKHTAQPPHHLVANAPYPYAPDHSEFGYGDPSGIFKHRTDGFYYMSATSRTTHNALRQGTVLMRTANLRDWKSWRCWNGSDFNVSFVDPYAIPAPNPNTLNQHVCKPISDLNFVVLSIKWSTYFHAYIATGEGIYTFENGSKTFAFFYKSALDDTLRNWSSAKLIRLRENNTTSISENYPSLLDDSATSRNFEEIGENAWLYYTRQTRHTSGSVCTRGPWCRDLYRQRISFNTNARVETGVVGSVPHLPPSKSASSSSSSSSSSLSSTSSSLSSSASSPLSSSSETSSPSTAFEVMFGHVDVIGESNYTHFWMPQPLFRASTLSTSTLMASVALHGDGQPCPPPNHPQACDSFWSQRASTGALWSQQKQMLPGNCIIRLNATMSRGLGGIVLNTSTNTSGVAYFTDWIEDEMGVRVVGNEQQAKIAGLPPMLRFGYLMSTSSAMIDGEAFIQFYGYLANAPTLGGCTGGVRYCYSVVTLASNNSGESWSYRSSINWDGRVMPADVEGPCEPSLVVLPDGKTLLSVFRVDSNKNMWQASSTDGGRTFSVASEMNAWAVFPQLRSLPNGALALTAGRPGIGLWLADGRSGVPASTSWQFHNLAVAHNKMIGSANTSLLYPAPELAIVNASSPPSNPVMTKAYTGLTLMECEGESCTMVVTYDRLSNGNGGPDPPGPHGPVDAAFSMRFVVQPLSTN